MKCGHCGTTGSFVTVEHVWNCSQHGDGPHRPEPKRVVMSLAGLAQLGSNIEGVYFRDNAYYKAIKSQEGNWYTKVWDALAGMWDYVGRYPLHNLTLADKVTAEQAAQFGKLTNTCIFCGRHLTDDREGRSVEVGYGPVCAEKHGLPWGDVPPFEVLDAYERAEGA